MWGLGKEIFFNCELLFVSPNFLTCPCWLPKMLWSSIGDWKSAYFGNLQWGVCDALDALVVFITFIFKSMRCLWSSLMLWLCVGNNFFTKHRGISEWKFENIDGVVYCLSQKVQVCVYLNSKVRTFFFGKYNRVREWKGSKTTQV
jgi:hypothetical protein